jgi:hypothetical protein
MFLVFGRKPISPEKAVLFELFDAGLKLCGKVWYRYKRSRPITASDKPFKCNFCVSCFEKL